MLHTDPVEVDPKEGAMLLADPMMDEAYFRRSAILLIDRANDGGHLGLTMNRELTASLSDLFPDWEGADKVPLFSGGPVDRGRLFMIHRLGEKVGDVLEIAPGLYVGGDYRILREYIASEQFDPEYVRFFLGYSGWAKGQLTSEIMRNSWAVNPNPDTSDILSGSEGEYWSREVRRLGPGYRGWLLIPEDPILN